MGSLRDKGDQPRTFEELMAILERPGLLEVADRALMADPVFAAAYRGRRRLRPSLDPMALCERPLGSLGRSYGDFLRHYQLPLRFFPLEVDSWGDRPCTWAARRLGEIHDVLHVLGEYEISDADEVAVQSFVAGQAPTVLALFLTASLQAQTSGGPVYVHLRQLPTQALSPIDLERGRAAAAVLGQDFEGQLDTPVTVWRHRLNIRPRRVRPRGAALINSCRDAGADVGAGPCWS
ncbi:MAG: hypothetical protein KC431_28780 [Myxococcales bacterium]|nr:hypothetical protein [Myxococcales bacterium]